MCLPAKLVDKAEMSDVDESSSYSNGTQTVCKAKSEPATVKQIKRGPTGSQAKVSPVTTVSKVGVLMPEKGNQEMLESAVSQTKDAPVTDSPYNNEDDAHEDENKAMSAPQDHEAVEAKIGPDVTKIPNQNSRKY
mmetsp:Transcript_16911/g.40441  ORF Transcript_16911/g.40441 Transcript_16911/m.40441 type:complete len:135 (-) Transcript_16911:704-1108(-)